MQHYFEELTFSGNATILCCGKRNITNYKLYLQAGASRDSTDVKRHLGNDIDVHRKVACRLAMTSADFGGEIGTTVILNT